MTNDPTDPTDPTACKTQDLTAMSIPEIVDFAIQALDDADLACFVQGIWLQIGAGTPYEFAEYIGGPAGGREAVRFKDAIKDPAAVRYCAVGAVLAADGAKAAFDWTNCSFATHEWKSGQLGANLFMRLSDVFEYRDAGQQHPDRTAVNVAACLRFLKAVKSQIDSPDLQRLFMDECEEARAWIANEYFVRGWAGECGDLDCNHDDGCDYD